MTDCCCCVYSRMIRTHERRALGVLLFLVSRSERARVDQKMYSVRGETWRLRSRIVVVFVVQCIDRYSYYCMYLVYTAAVFVRLCSVT